jgi:hypothetical protein
MRSKPQLEREAIPEDWARRAHDHETLRSALIEGGAAGVNSHDRPNVMWKIKRLVEGDAISQFGLTGVSGLPFEEVLRLVAEASGISPDPSVRHGVVIVDPHKVIEGLEAVGDRLAQAADRGERVLLATGHPAGLPLLYQATGDLLTQAGAKLIRPLEGHTWNDDEGRRRQVRYFRGVALLTDRASPFHTHSSEAMERMLEDETPDLVFADHGFAGAAIEAGIDTVSVADVNDPALVVARAQGRAGPVVVMDDNVQPEAYWPCFQVIASRFPG